MFFHAPIFSYSLVYFIELQLILWQEEWVVGLTFLLLGVTFGVTRKLGRRLTLTIIPLFFTLASVLLLYLIDSFSQRQFFVLLSTLAYYAALLGTYRLRRVPEDPATQGLTAFSSTLTLFFFYSAIYGFYLNFAISLWVFMLVYCVGTVLVTYSYFGTLKRDNPALAWMYSFILGLVMAEVAWMINFWPFGYLTTGVVVLIFYYLLWDLTQSYFLSILSQKRVLVHIASLGLLIGMILMSSRWLPTV
jgi:hypothetical protein